MHRSTMGIFLAALVSASFLTVSAQTFNVYGVNSSAFPKITADYVAFDAAGNPITDLTAPEFSVVETPQGGNPVDLSASVTHTCVDQQTDPEASIIIILDRSQSMSDVVDGKSRWETAKDAIRAFVNRVKFVGRTRVSLVSFAGNYVVINEWVDNKQPVLDSLVLLQWQTVTNYVLPFEAPASNIYELFKKRPADVPKYVFFLTDGHPNPAINDEIKFVNDNSQKLQAQGIRFFSITIKETFTHWTLEALAKATGGKSIVTDEKGVVDLFSYLALETQIKKLCQLNWISPSTCNEQGQNRSTFITMKRGGNPSSTVQYLAPAKSVARVDVSDPVLFCGDPPPNNTNFANVTITAQNSTFSANAFNIVPSTFFTVVDWNYPTNQATFSPFNLAPNAKRVIRVQFKQGASQAFRQAQLTFAGGPCPPNVILVGGTGVVLLQSPDGGEVFSTCDTVTIKWAGVVPTQPVTISYSEDNGVTFPNIITNNATGLSYKWLPPRAGVQYRVRVAVSSAKQFVWAKQLGGAGAETATSVAVLQSGLKVFASGYFDGPTKIGATTSANMAGNTDGYLAEMDTDGNITNVMLLTGTASNDERVIGTVVDKLGNMYVAGYFSSPAVQFGPFSVAPRAPLDTRNMFVYKFAPDGSLAWSNISKGSATQSSFADASNIGIRYDISGNPELIVVGTFQKYIEVGINTGGTFERAGPYTNSTPRPYYVVYDIGGYPRLTANAAAPVTGVTYKAKTAIDGLGFDYETDNYSGPKSFSPPTINLPNLGLTDVFVTKNGATPSSHDSSSAAFSVQAPQLSFIIPKASFPATPQGQTSTQSYTGVLKNTGSFPVTVQTINVAGVNNTDFRLSSQIIGVRIEPGKSLSLEIVFAPTGTGLRTALLEVIGNCNATAQLLLEGDGLAPCAWENQTNVNLGKVPLSQGTSPTVTCVLKNVGPLDLKGTLSEPVSNPDITVRNPGPFTLTANGGCLNVDLTIAAATPGVKSITLAFGLPAECGVPTTTIVVEIVEPRVAIDSVDFGRVRLLTPVLDTISVTNLNSDPAVITGFSLSNAADPNFVVTLPAPQALAPGAVIRVPVRYTPQTRGAHAINVIGTVQGQAAPLIGEAKGFGFLPAISAVGYTFNAWTIGALSPETGNVVITNTDPSSPLRIERIAFATANASFAWVGALPTFPLTLAPGSAPLVLPVSFTPQIAGVNTVNVCVTHDAKTGPGPVPPYTDTCVVVSGVGLDKSDIPPINFARTLTCATRKQTFVITNPSGQFPLKVQSPTAVGDVAAFSIDQNVDFVIPPGGSKTITITFQPPAVNLYSITYSFANDQSLKLNVTASGEGIKTFVDFRFNNVVTGQVGQVVSLPVVASVDALAFAGAMPTEFTLTFTHDTSYIKFNSFVAPSMPGWTFTPTVSPGRVVVLAQTAGSPFVSGNFVTPAFDIYLNADSSLPVTMTVSTLLDCLIPSGDKTDITMKQVCFSTGRLVTIGIGPFSLKNPQSNPVRDQLIVEYSTGIALATSFQVVDAVGNIVSESSSPVVPAGVFLYELNTSTLATGAYFLRMISGPFVATTQFVVVK
ncbi:MAG: choice-of-anchor D domain-containing protein [Candidatus Kapabacteria bacterium]|nr:choice-of-anchor D domain-containing protein [Candidatus Kapabacteria bacterium]